MKRVILATSMGAFLAMASIATAQAAGQATKDEATALVGKAVAYLKSAGKDKALAEFSNKTGPFIDRDLYIVAYDMTGKCLAHGANEKLVGKDLSDAEDSDGKLYIKERMELAKAKPKFWQDYKFTNPVSKKIEPKEMYCEVVGDVAVCGGVYKK